ncbi:hypothetical protein Tco_0318980 [Tanacetum coccineum]
MTSALRRSPGSVNANYRHRGSIGIITGVLEERNSTSTNTKAVVAECDTHSLVMTLTRVLKLGQMVKDFYLYEYNQGMETRKLSEDDKRRSKDFFHAIREKDYRSKGSIKV